MELEIERKYLLPKDYDKSLLDGARIQSIEQGYLSLDYNFRVRIITEDGNETAYITLKKGKGVVREEYEDTISLDLGKELLKKALILVEKTRYKYLYKGKIWDVDYFHNKKLWVAEIELESEDETFEILPQAIKEVTEVSKYKNKKLGIKTKLFTK